MANRNFRKNLALLCALAAGYGALSSINISTSAMESDRIQKMENDIQYLVESFKTEYDPFHKKDEMRKDIETLTKEYSTRINESTASTLARSAVWYVRKQAVIGVLNDHLKALKAGTFAGCETEKQNEEAQKIELLIEKMNHSNIAWKGDWEP